MMPFITRRRHDAEMAALDARLQHQIMAAGVWKQHYEDSRADVTRLVQEKLDLKARLDALTPARDQGGKWVKKGGITYPAECDTTLPTPPETTA